MQDGEERREEPRGGKPAISLVLPDGNLAELVYDPEKGETAFVVGSSTGWTKEDSITSPAGETLRPYSPQNNLLLHDVVLLPSEPAEYGTDADLIADIRAFIHHYVDLSPLFEEVSTYYVLLSWVYDRFAELPYLRVQGDYGSGKSRFLLTVGSLCYKPIFASGASSVSPIFRILDAFKGTLVIDEADFRASDEKAEVVKILNNGNARGFPVLRSEVSRSGEINPQAFAVFGPKLVATRGPFADRALESRCLTEEMGGMPLRDDIPLNLTDEHKMEARALRNKLLLFRLRNFDMPRDLSAFADRTIEPRLAQIFAPLVSLIQDGATRDAIRNLARRYGKELTAARGMDAEAEVLAIIREMDRQGAALSVKDIAARFSEIHAAEYGRPITPKWLGGILRRKLGLKPEKSHGIFLIPPAERPKLSRLYEKYGLESAP
jgi:hypothetical protein